jgi:prolipoprotein diacylglyceryltransferase
VSIHLVFDLIAAAISMLVTVAVYRWRLGDAVTKIESAGLGYALSLVAGAAIGGYGLGSLNLCMMGDPTVGRSIAGALAGATLAIEIFKWRNGIKGSTGIIFVPAFCTSVAIGRIGCFLSGIEDQTHGVPTARPWGQEFGDGMLRHPVQLYEAAAMALFLVWALAAIGKRLPFFLQNGFYIMAGFYGLQRLAWEFLKPYPPVIGPFNVFHIVCAGLVLYAIYMLSVNRALAKSPVT